MMFLDPALDLYLGTPEEPVPFGGRAGELKALDDWLLEPGQPPNALLVAPAGRGKSTLAVRWLSSVQQRSLARVLFVPVSARFRTNSSADFFGALACLLSAAHGQAAPSLLNSVDMPRLCESLLALPSMAELPLLLVLDGLDEAAGWEVDRFFFPAVQPAGLRILVSARSFESETTDFSWRRQLGWESPERACSISLTKLTLAGIVQVMENLGNPLAGLAPKKEIVATLYRLSDAGDPLLVRLYVDRLREKGEAAGKLTKAELDALEPGLQGYFDDWYADQRRLWGSSLLFERSIPLLFSLFALAFGPLLHKDLQELIEPSDQVNSLAVDEALLQMRRWIVGDGESNGYIFQHPRLSEYFYHKLSTQERTAYERRITAYGWRTLKALNSQSLQPKDASAYLLQNYSAHLQRLGEPAVSFYALVSQGWMQAWYFLEGTYSGFLSDVAHAWSKADESLQAGNNPSHSLVEQIRCALCQSSVAALSSNIPPELLALAMKEGIFSPTQALVFASQIANEWHKQNALIAIAPFLGGQINGAQVTLRTIKNESFKINVLICLASYLPQDLKAQALLEALSLVLFIRDEYTRADVLFSMAPHLPKELMRETLAFVREIKDESLRVKALGGLAPHLPKELMGEALALAWLFKEESSRARALSGLAPFLSKELIGEVLAFVRVIKDESSRARALSGLAPYLSKELIGESLALVWVIKDESLRVKALGGLAPHLPKELMGEALALVWIIKDESLRVKALGGLAPHLPKELIGEALALAWLFKEESSRARALSGLAPYLPKELMGQAFTLVRSLGYQSAKVEALSGLAPYLAKDLMGEAFALVRSIGYQSAQVAALSGLAPYLAKELQSEALALVQEIRDEDIRADALSGLAPYLPKNLMGEALALVRMIENEYIRAEILSKLVPHLTPELQSETVQEALDLVQAIHNNYYQIEVLCSLTPHLPKKLMGEALAILRLNWDQSSQVDALSSLAPYLPKELMGEVLALVRSITDQSSRVDALNGLAPYLPKEMMREAVREALASVWTIMDEYFQLRVLACLVPQLSREIVEKVLASARTIKDQPSRARALTCLLPLLPQELKENALTEALAMVPGIKHDIHQGEVLRGLAPHLSKELIENALALVLAIEDKSSWAQALIGFAPFLPEELLGEGLRKALVEAREIVNNDDREDWFAFSDLHMPEDRMEETTPDDPIDEQAIEGEYFRFEALTNLASYLPDELKRQTVSEDQALERIYEDEEYLAGVMSGLAPIQSEDLFMENISEDLDEVHAIMDEYFRVEALSCLASQFSLEKMREILAVARATEDKIFRAQKLNSLAPHLLGWAKINFHAASNSWCDTIHDLSRYRRSHFLDDLSILLPFALSLLPEASRPEAAAGIFRAIQEICSWWP